MIHFDENKLEKLHNASDLLDAKYGTPETERKELKMTQKELAEKTGTARSYIARVERGETDMQLSSFLRIANALRMSFVPTFV